MYGCYVIVLINMLFLLKATKKHGFFVHIRQKNPPAKTYNNVFESDKYFALSCLIANFVLRYMSEII